MKKIFSYTSILLGVVLLQSCSKQSSDEMLISPQSNNTANGIEATVKSNALYQLNLSDFNNVAILKQASHFQISQAGIDSKTGSMVYKYTPAQDYTGADEVMLTASKTVAVTGSGCSNGNNHTSTTSTVTSNISIKINVTN